MKSLSSSRREVLVDCFHVHACHISHLLPGSAVLQHSAALLGGVRLLSLARAQHRGDPRRVLIYIGLPQLVHPKWVRLGITSLEEYARHFNCVTR